MVYELSDLQSSKIYTTPRIAMAIFNMASVFVKDTVTAFLSSSEHREERQAHSTAAAHLQLE